jgi:hypothetical protein
MKKRPWFLWDVTTSAGAAAERNISAVIWGWMRKKEERKQCNDPINFPNADALQIALS